jgi:hypothetical protein
MIAAAVVSKSFCMGPPVVPTIVGDARYQCRTGILPGGFSA